jgi:hypothetical protein
VSETFQIIKGLVQASKFRISQLAIWGLSKVSPDIASLVTAYVPDPKKWNSDFRTRVIP